jgi:uncharacterized protein (TIGR00645 family)
MPVCAMAACASEPEFAIAFGMERAIERLLFSTRWLLAPIYLGLAVLLAVISLHFLHELAILVWGVMHLEERDLILAVLSFVDIALVAGLVVMVMLSGYENFVSKLDIEDTSKNLAWLGKLDAGSLKLKVAASIVAISSIHLLRAFMNVHDVANDKLILLIATHLTFVVSALLLTLMDRMSSHEKP